MVGIIKFERLWGIRKTTVVKFIETLGDHSARMRREIKKIDKRKWFGKKKKKIEESTNVLRFLTKKQERNIEYDYFHFGRIWKSSI